MNDNSQTENVNEYRVLIIDRALPVREKIASIIAEMGLPHISAASDFEALKLINEYSDISLIISDYSLGTINGNELLARINGDDKRNIPTIFLASEKPSINDEAEANRNNARNWLYKPVSEQVLLSAINEVRNNP